MWPLVSLESIKSGVKGALVSGPFGSNIGSRFFVDDGVPVIRGNNLTLGRERFLDQGFVFVTESKARELKNCLAIRDDLVFTAAGTLGQVGLIPQGARFEKYVISNKQIRLRLDVNRCLPLFAYYYLSSPAMRAFIASQNKGSSVPLLTLGIIRKVPIHLPPLHVQLRIASVLSAYDDLIENNRQRIALLERMAEQLYREWFVRFRFPGYQQAKFEKGKPASWTSVPVARAFRFTGGATPAKDTARYWTDGTINWFTPSDITAAEGLFLGESSLKCTEEGLSSCSATLFPAYSVMMTSRATIGAIGINTTSACTNQGFIACLPNEHYPLSFLYHWLKLSKDYFLSLCGGATFPELTKGTFKRIEVLTPPSSLVTEFDRRVAPVFESMERLGRANVLLAQTRDLLLPRLISGKLRVDDLDIRFPPSMQAERA